MDADLAFETGGLKIQEIKIGKTRVKVDLVSDKLTTNLTEMALYDGTGKATIVVDSTPAVPTIKSTLTLSGLKARSFLNDAAGMDSLEGTANVEIDLAMAGKSQRQIVSSLAGSGKIAFLDGVIIGINLADMMRNVSTAFLGPKSGAPQKPISPSFPAASPRAKASSKTKIYR